jgi:hypothetical protein
MGLTMKEKQAVTREYKGRYLKAAKKEKRALLDQFIRFTGNHRKSAIRLLSPQRPVREVLVCLDGKPLPEMPGTPVPPAGNSTVRGATRAGLDL